MPRTPTWILAALAAGFPALAAAPVSGAAPASPAAREAESPVLAMADCKSGGTPARCGTLTVFENRTTRTGRKIDLRIVVLTAGGEDPAPDPIFFLHGGPGGAASDLAAMFAISPLRERRDIVLVDQRGTGESNGLECPSRSLQETFEAMTTFVLPGVEECRKSYEADLTQYTTTIAMADLDDVRRALGYDTINLFGGSYGTRAALEYMRRYPAHTRTAYLRGVHPPAGVLPANFDRDSQAALDSLLADCAAEPACGRNHPGLREKLAGILARLEEKPERIELANPVTGRREMLEVDDRIFRGVIHYTLYSSLMAARLPGALDEAVSGSVRPVIENVLPFAVQTEVAISFGMFLSVACAEDAPFLNLEQIDREAHGTLLGGRMSRGLLRSCAGWPRAELAADYKRPVESDVPALIVSGAVDPVTAPHLAAEAARHLPHSLHLVVAGTSHGDWTPGCVSALLERFLERGSVEGLDVSCVADVGRPGFLD